MMWPDIEIELVAWLEGQLTGPQVMTELPANLADLLPLVQIRRVGGDDDAVRLDRALVDVDVYASTWADASAIARQVREELVMQLRGVATAGAVFGRVDTVAAPAWRPYENPGLRRSGATYEMFFHIPVS